MLKQAITAIIPIAMIAGCSSYSPTTGNFRNQGYLLDQSGVNAVVKAQGYDTCVRTSDWTPARAVIECDPDLVPKPVVKAPPAPKVETPPPPQVVAPPPAKPKPVLQRYTLSTDTMFAFDKALLTSTGRSKLDELAIAIRGTQHDTIVVTGHTDRIGTPNYNRSLSERRAEAVKQYLLGKGLDPGKISSSGKGETQPVTKPGACPRGMPVAAVIACLQPDRRVEVEVSGSKLVEPGATPAAKPEALAPRRSAPADAVNNAKEAAGRSAKGLKPGRATAKP